MTKVKDLETFLKSKGMHRARNKSLKLTTFNLSIKEDVSFVVLIHEITREKVVIDFGVRVGCVERLLEEYESDRMKALGFKVVDEINRPTFFKKVHDGYLSEFDLERFEKDYSMYTMTDTNSDQTLESFYDRLRSYNMPAELQDGGASYLAKRALIYNYLDEKQIKNTLSEVFELIDGARAYSTDIAELGEWLEKRQKK